MNERIEHITKQVDEYFDDLTIEFSRQAWMEKFAELIVRECAGIYSKIDNGNSHMGTDNYLEALHKTFRG